MKGLVEKLSRIQDSTSGENGKKKVADSARVKAMNKVRVRRALSKLRDSEDVEEAVEVIKDVPVKEIMETVSEVLKTQAPAIEEATKVEDSNRRDRAVIDSIKQKLYDTESTEDALQVATESLKEASPVEVITAAMEILDEVSERIPEE